MLNILIDIIIDFSIPPILLKGLHLKHLKIYEIFWYAQIENGLFVKIQKTWDTKRARILHHSYKKYFSNENVPVHNSKS